MLTLILISSWYYYLCRGMLYRCLFVPGLSVCYQLSVKTILIGSRFSWIFCQRCGPVRTFLNLRSHSSQDPNLVFLKDSSTLRDLDFFLWKNWRDLRQNHRSLSLDMEVPSKFWKSSGTGFRIGADSSSWRGLHSPSTLVNNILRWVAAAEMSGR